jgi:hypothetical protein
MDEKGGVCLVWAHAGLEGCSEGDVCDSAAGVGGGGSGRRAVDERYFFVHERDGGRWSRGCRRQMYFVSVDVCEVFV